MLSGTGNPTKLGTWTLWLLLVGARVLEEQPGWPLRSPLHVDSTPYASGQMFAHVERIRIEDRPCNPAIPECLEPLSLTATVPAFRSCKRYRPLTVSLSICSKNCCRAPQHPALRGKCSRGNVGIRGCCSGIQLKLPYYGCISIYIYICSK